MSIEAEDAAAWEALEAEHFEAPARRVDSVRVRGYLLACCRRVATARVEVERRVTLLECARREADVALSELRSEVEHAEEMARLVALGDAGVNERLARALEELEG